MGAAHRRRAHLERVLVERCDLSVNDDAICIKAGRDWDGLRVARPCRQVTIRDCIVRDALAWEEALKTRNATL